VPLCYVEFRSPTFKILLDGLKKRFPHIEEDLKEVWVDIATDHERARHADPIPRYKRIIWKYRAPCSDMQRGAKGSYRIVAYFHQPKNTLYPILIYHKAERSDVDDKTIAAAMKELLELIK
jgi:mRNA-degrading endonuclease RelE of RelBE toxin-antitoxin system